MDGSSWFRPETQVRGWSLLQLVGKGNGPVAVIYEDRHRMRSAMRATAGPPADDTLAAVEVAVMDKHRLPTWHGDAIQVIIWPPHDNHVHGRVRRVVDVDVGESGSLQLRRLLCRGLACHNQSTEDGEPDRDQKACASHGIFLP